MSADAHLEPDRRFGVGYFEATRMACLRVALKHDTSVENESLAVVIHVFYTELLDECMSWLADLDLPHDVS